MEKIMTTDVVKSIICKEMKVFEEYIHFVDEKLDLNAPIVSYIDAEASIINVLYYLTKKGHIITLSDISNYASTGEYFFKLNYKNNSDIACFFVGKYVMDKLSISKLDIFVYETPDLVFNYVHHLEKSKLAKID